MPRWLRVLSVVCVLVVLPIQPAKACSCAYGDPRDMFAGADAAFVGTFVESHPVEEPTSSDADTVYTFLLDEEHKGELGERGGTVEVHAALSGASCGLEASPGEQYGIFLYVRETDGAWTSSLCSQVSPETMREAASPLPAPTSDGPPRIVAGGSFGDTQTMFLDGDGATVGYGPGDRDVTHVSACRGAARVLEIGVTYPDPPVLSVRDVSSFDVVRTVDLPIGRGRRFRSMFVAGVHCLDEAGERAVVFAADYGSRRPESVLLAVDGDDFRVLERGSARSATFSAGVAYLREGKSGRRLTRVALDDGTKSFVTRLSGRILTELAVSPDGRNLTFVSSERSEVTRENVRKVVVVKLRDGSVRTRTLGTAGRPSDVLWLSDDRIVMFASSAPGSRVFDLDLRTRGRFGRWGAHTTALAGRTAFGVDYEGRLFEVELPDGTPRVSRRLPSPVVYDLISL
jgi:hypothetical protein